MFFFANASSLKGKKLYLTNRKKSAKQMFGVSLSKDQEVSTNHRHYVDLLKKSKLNLLF